MNKYLGIDVGGTNIRGAIITENGEVIERHKTASEAKKGIGTLINNIEKFFHHFSNYNLQGVGIGIPGIIDQKKGLLTQAPNIKNAKDYPIKKALLNKLNLPIEIENDANCAALGEYWIGESKKVSSLIILTIGTGLGGGIILDDKLWNGSNGMGGEIGHMTINPEGPRCNCGNYGCIESYVSAEAIRRIVGETEDLKQQLINIKKEDIPEELMKLALKKNKIAVKIWKDLGKYLGLGIANLVNILNVEMVIIGGGLSNAWELFIKQTKDEVKKRGLSGPVENLKIKKASLGDDAGIFGACYLAINRNNKA
ncbi:MAG: ROK family protein [Candidatus Dadabacteria bacterium]|nr:ROK family protein [Candidatus Dadabacteria bacterium]NIQ16610.1 ROK family protein [Candidatus Dadabacteria bacterium]